MIDSELLDLLVCPETRTRVELAEAALIDRVNRAIATTGVRNRAGEELAEPLQGGLIREDGKMLYPIVDDIPTLLVDEAVSMDQLEE